MPLAEFEPATPAFEHPQTHALDRAVTATGQPFKSRVNIYDGRYSMNAYSIQSGLTLYV